jgi:hypothetical protein
VAVSAAAVEAGRLRHDLAEVAEAVIGSRWSWRNGIGEVGTGLRGTMRGHETVKNSRRAANEVTH